MLDGTARCAAVDSVRSAALGSLSLFSGSGLISMAAALKDMALAHACLGNKSVRIRTRLELAGNGTVIAQGKPRQNANTQGIWRRSAGQGELRAIG